MKSFSFKCHIGDAKRYALKKSVKIKWLLSALVFSAFFVILYVYTSIGLPTPYFDDDVWFLVTYGCLLGAVIMVANAYGTFLILWPDKIVVSKYFLRTSVPFNRIMGRSDENIYLKPGYIDHPVSLDIKHCTKYMDIDDEFSVWYQNLPVYADVLSEQQRAFWDKNLSFLPCHKITFFLYKHLWFVPTVLFCLLFIPYYIALEGVFSYNYLPEVNKAFFHLAWLCPVISTILYFRWSDVFTYLFPRHSSVKISLYGTHIFFALLLMIALIPTVHTNGINAPFFEVREYWLTNIYLWFCIVLLCAVPMSDIRSCHTYGLKAFLFVICLFWGVFASLGLFISYNLLFDDVPVTIEKVKAFYKHPMDDRPKNTVRILNVVDASAEEHDDKNKKVLIVGFDMYEKVQEGDIVCLYSYKGAAGIPWRQLQFCPNE